MASSMYLPAHADHAGPTGRAKTGLQGYVLFRASSQEGATGHNTLWLTNLKTLEKRAVFTTTLSAGFHYSCSPDSSKALVELWSYTNQDTEETRVLIIDLRGTNKIIKEIEDARYGVWKGDTTAGYCDSKGNMFQWNLSLRKAELVGHLSEGDDRKYTNYLSMHFSDEIRRLWQVVHRNAFRTRARTAILHPQMCEPDEAATWYLRTKDIALPSPLIEPAIEFSVVPSSACASPDGSNLAFRRAEDVSSTIFVLYGAGRELWPVKAFPGRSFGPQLEWLPHNSRLLFVEYAFDTRRKGRFPPYLRSYIYLYDVKRRSKTLVAEGEAPHYVSKLGPPLTSTPRKKEMTELVFADRQAPSFDDMTNSRKHIDYDVWPVIAVSFDGQWTAFSWQRDGIWRLHLTNLKREITVWTGLESSPMAAIGVNRQVFSWIPGRQRYSADTKNTSSQILKLPYDFAAARISPRGNRIALILRRKGGIQINDRLLLLKLPNMRGSLVDHVDFPVQDLYWSPRGDRIALLRRTERGHIRNPREHLYIYDVTSNRLSPLVIDRAIQQGSLNWSPDGESMFFAERNWPGPGLRRIWQIDVSTKAMSVLQCLDESGPSGILHAYPCRDGSGLLTLSITAEEEIELHFWDYRSKIRWVIVRGDVDSPVWFPKDNMFAVVVNRILWVVDRQTLQARRVFPKSIQ